jgi:hypothetical protein
VNISIGGLDALLDLVKPLDDSPGEEAGREKFRRFLKNNVREVGQVRDFVEECLRKSGDQYNRAFQDLINYVGQLLGFDVTFGRYKGATGKPGFDGYWRSPSDNTFHVVVEVKTTEVYAIKTATILGYIHDLVSEKKIPDADSAVGLYVVGRPDPEVSQLENNIVAEKKTSQLRIISADSLISLAEMMSEFDVSHEDVLSILRPSGPTIDAVVDLMGRLLAARQAEEPIGQPPATPEPSEEREAQYWLTPVKGDKIQTAEEVIESLVAKNGIYAFGERTPGRKHLKPGDGICFYANAKGVIAHARVASAPEKKPHRAVRHSEKYEWTFRVAKSRLYIEEPVVIDAALRAKLQAFEGRDQDKSWAWFVQATRKITEHDYRILTRG